MEMVESPTKKDDLNIFSTHSFLFPFVIEAKDNKQKLNIDILKKKLLPEKWKPKYFSLHDSAWEYNKKSYFYDHVYNAFFPETPETPETNETNLVTACFEKYFGDEFKITLEDQTEYKLKIDKISLFVFNTSIGILCFDLLNTDDKHASPEDILKINDFGRRVYPQFISETEGLKETKKKFLADRIDILDKGKKIFPDSISEFTEEWFFNKNDDQRKIKIAPYILHILGNQFLTEGDFSIKPIIDDRMFTVCWYGNDDKMRFLQTELHDQGSLAFERDDFWYRYIFVDGQSLCCPNPFMKRNLIKQTTYDRWVSTDQSEGSIFGLSRCSLVCLTDEGTFSKDVIRNHVYHLYRSFAVILLAQRASIIKFSGDVSKISGNVKTNDKDSQVQKEINEEVTALNENFIRFINRMWFREVTAQEQGIEMYSMAQMNMNLQNQLEDLKSEISQLYESTNLVMQKQASKTSTVINIISILFFPITLISSIWGMNLYFMNIFYGGFKGTQVPARMPYITVTIILFILSIVFSISYTIKIFDTVNQKHSAGQVRWKKTLVSSFKGIGVWLPAILFLLVVTFLIWINFFR
ncbi:MAG: hypothetical protein MUO31_11805 [Thermodesulfovibrionales bacterium]|nr:hypothetical protein [Thermodesulfovibrionales bacterium]